MSTGIMETEERLAPVRPLVSSADGWRGRIGREFTPESAQTLMRAILDRIAAEARHARIAIAFDSREGSGEVALRLAALTRQTCGCPPRVIRHLPTATASYLTTGDVDYAVLVTASHNPPGWNGIKLKTPGGQPASSQFVADVERRLEAECGTGRDNSLPEEVPSLPVEAADEFCTRHFDHILRRLDPGARHDHAVVIDGLNGVAGMALSRLGEMLGWRVQTLACTPRSDFGGLQPDPSKAASRCRIEAAVRASGADFGLVPDGDGDRLYVIDETGTTVQPHDLTALVLRHAIARGQRIRKIALTQSVGMSVRLEARRLGLPVTETPIGFKYLAPLLSSGEAGLAAGAVGDLAVAGWSTDRDPFAIAALVSQMLSLSGMPLSRMTANLRRDLGTEALRWIEYLVVPETNVDMTAMPDVLRCLARHCGLRGGIESAPVQRLPHGAVRLRGPDHQWLLVRGSTTDISLTYIPEG